jgi:predicted nucleic acid-binding protein
VSVAYLDTSALVKRYITEIGSGWVRAFLREPTTRAFTSLLTIIEGTCTFARRRREGMLSPGDHRHVLDAFDYDLTYRYNVLQVEPRVIDTARQMAGRNPLRAYDAVQLATAWLLNQDLLDDGQAPPTTA